MIVAIEAVAIEMQLIVEGYAKVLTKAKLAWKVSAEKMGKGSEWYLLAFSGFYQEAVEKITRTTRASILQIRYWAKGMVSRG